MPLARSRFRARRHELAHPHGPLNLVPLVDILTAIVFFSLLSAVSLRTALASFDLAAPPAVADGLGTGTATPRPDVVVRVDRRQFVVRDGDREIVIGRPQVSDEAAFAQLRHTLTSITRTLGQRGVVTVVPSDDVAYDEVIRVLEQVQQVDPKGVALGSRARVRRHE
jgi:biopolymer transport protein ExbD